MDLGGQRGKRVNSGHSSGPRGWWWWGGPTMPQSTPSKTWPSPEWFHRVLELEKARNVILSNPAILQKRKLRPGIGKYMPTVKAPETQFIGQPSCWAELHSPPRNKSLLFSKKGGELHVQSKSYSRPPLLKQKHTRGAWGIHSETNYSLTILRSQAAFGATPSWETTLPRWLLSLTFLASIHFRHADSLPQTAPQLIHTVKGIKLRKKLT